MFKKFFKNRIIQALLPVLVLFLFIAGASDFGRIVLDEEPGITLSNGETISNSTDGTITISGALSTGNYISSLGTSSGNAYFEPGLAIDTVVHTDIYNNSIHDRTKLFFAWGDSTTGGKEDSITVSLTYLSTDSIILTASEVVGSAGDTGIYFYILFN